MKRERERDKERQTDRQTERQRQRDRDRETETERQRQTGRETETERQRHRTNQMTRHHELLLHPAVFFTTFNNVRLHEAHKAEAALSPPPPPTPPTPTSTTSSPAPRLHKVSRPHPVSVFSRIVRLPELNTMVSRNSDGFSCVIKRHINLLVSNSRLNPNSKSLFHWLFLCISGAVGSGLCRSVCTAGNRLSVQTGCFIAQFHFDSWVNFTRRHDNRRELFQYTMTSHHKKL